ncbi:MAG: RNA polymerase sigma factor [uncultured Thiotrichaceae bacterium]|uniref:RNA polymerase sigma factor n=1 Tax=uncultured Thiotrichaceae bacterium TaxID=298394 RepID=A0A6S6U745_9GAMM|nr:MAG: RNA polymerase sigma factor [uncultured Thiotrichaceae bacterium]
MHNDRHLHYAVLRLLNNNVTISVLACISRQIHIGNDVNTPAIIQQIENGDSSAFELLVTYFQQPLFGYLGRMGLSQTLAEDIAQETFLRAWQKLASFDAERATFSTWLFTIAHRLALNELSRKGNQVEINAEPAFDAAEDSKASPDDQVDLQLNQASLRNAMLQLPVNDRNVLALAYTKGLDMRCLAEIEGVSVSAVKVRVYRAKQRLLTILEKHHAER